MDALLTPPLPTGLLLISLFIVGLAGVVRGFAGFGFSALSVAGLALLVSPARVVPAIFILEVLASMGQLPGVVRDVDRRWLTWLVLGNALCIPLGIALLAWLPETQLRLLIAVLLVVAAGMLRSSVHLALSQSPGVLMATGMVSGVVNGVAAIGGIVVSLFLSATQMAPGAMRATMIALFLFTDLYALAWAGLLSLTGAATLPLLGLDTWRWVLWLAPVMGAGIWIGQKSFIRTSQAQFRRRVLNLLMCVAMVSVVRSLLALLD